MKITATFLYILFTLTFFSNASANDPAIHHQLSVAAVRQFESCFPNESLSPTAKMKFIDYSALEDSVLHNPMRLRQWHFFSPAGDLGRSRGGSRISLDKRFNKLDKQLRNAIEHRNANKIYEILGRLTHYLQDVTSPAHVMPIYHWSGQKDAFDGYPFDEKAATAYFESHKDAVCAAVSSPPQHSLFSVLTETAKRTQAASQHAPLKISNGTANQATWALFWQEDKSCKNPVKPKFKDYGPFGNRFGDSEITDRCDLDKTSVIYSTYCGGPVCNIDQSVYATFAINRHRDAIMASLKALYSVTSKLKQPAQP